MLIVTVKRWAVYRKKECQFWN